MSEPFLLSACKALALVLNFCSHFNSLIKFSQAHVPEFFLAFSTECRSYNCCLGQFILNMSSMESKNNEVSNKEWPKINKQ